MKPTAIIYTSRTGYTRKYAEMLAEKTELPAVSSDSPQAKEYTGKHVIYLGWLCAGSIKGYSKASLKYKITAVCAVGLCDTGTMVEETRKTNRIPESIPVFTLQGGFSRSQLKGVNKMMISMMAKGLSDKKERTEEEERMLQMVSCDSDYVSEENLGAVLNMWGSL